MQLKLGTKLLIGLLVLLILVVGFLDGATLSLISSDKKASTYESQATEAILAGQEFSRTVDFTLNTLRFSLAGLDFRQIVAGKTEAAIRSILENQSNLVAMTLAFTESNGERFETFLQVVQPGALAKLGLQTSDLIFPDAMLRPLYADFKKNGIVFLNLSKPGKLPILGMVFAANGDTSGKGKTFLALGHVSLDGFGKHIKASQVTIATRRGQVLFDTNPNAMFAGEGIKDNPLFQLGSEGRVPAGAREFEVDGKRFLGSFYLPGHDLVVLTRSEWRRAMRSLFSLGERYVLLGLIALGSAGLFAIFVANTVVRPIRRLETATLEVAGGNFDVQLRDGRRTDEIGTLSRAFMAMAKRIRELIQESVRRVKLENDLAITSTVQRNLIPDAVYRDSEVSIFSHYQSAEECGGDWWGHFRVGNQLVVMVADATGHGLPSALTTAAARAAASLLQLRAERSPEEPLEPSAMLIESNRAIHDSARGQLNMTAFLAVADLRTGKLKYASAGHNPVWLFRPEGSGSKIISLTASGQRLGEKANVDGYEVSEVEIAAGDVLLFYTDGLTEAKDLSGNLLGKKRVREIVQNSLSSGAQATLAALEQELNEFGRGKPLDDDVTFALVEIRRLAPGGIA